jgi:hypothetical protein
MKPQLIVVVILFVETRGSTLEEISVLFDGKGQIDHLRVQALDRKVAGIGGEVIEVENAKGPKSSD